MRECLDPNIKADQSAQNVDDFGIAVKLSEKLITNLQEVFKSFKNAGAKLSSAKRHFGTEKVAFLERNNKPNGVIPQKKKARGLWKGSNSLALEKQYNDTLVFSIDTEITFRVQQRD